MKIEFFKTEDFKEQDSTCEVVFCEIAADKANDKLARESLSHEPGKRLMINLEKPKCTHPTLKAVTLNGIDAYECELCKKLFEGWLTK